MARFAGTIYVFLAYSISNSLSRTKESWIPGKNCFLNNLTITALHDPPYVNNVQQGNNSNSHSGSSDGILVEFVRGALQACSRSLKCPPKHIKSLPINVVGSTDDLLTAIEEAKSAETGIVFPIPPSLTSQDLKPTVRAGVRYFPVMKSPGPALVVNYRVCKSLTYRMILKTMFSVWPLLVLALLLAGIAGVCMWALEYHASDRQFSRPFPHGPCEGFWWAAVSMTSLSYGDHIPKSPIGRLFAIVWILTGLSLVSVFTATLTSAITVVSVNQQCKDMQGKNIAVLNNSESESTARHKGANVTTFADVEAMLSALNKDVFEGMLLDRMRAYYYLNKLEDDNLRVSQVIDSSLTYSLALVPNSVGRLLANNSCFMGILGNPNRRVNKIVKNYIKPVKPLSSSDDEVGIFPSESIIIRNVLAGIGTVLAVSILCGASWEIFYRRKSCFRSANIPNQLLVNNTQGIQLHKLGPGQMVEVMAAIDKLTAEIEKLKELIGENGADDTTKREECRENKEHEVIQQPA